jgi:hypothetical protein
MKTEDRIDKMIEASLRNLRSDQYVNDVVAAAIMGCKPQTLRNWRFKKIGPNYIRKGRMIRYKVADLWTFMESGRIVLN